MIEIYYDKDMKQYKNEPKNCCAKYKKTDRGNEVFFIMFNERNLPFNPLEYALVRLKTKERFKFINVRKEIFEMYLDFLTKKNTIVYSKILRMIVSEKL